MEKTKAIINVHLERFPDFEYYLRILEVIEVNLDSLPDTSIEACQSLIGGISKSILNELRGSYNDGERADSVSSLVKKVLLMFNGYVDIDESFIQHTCGLVGRMGEIRNERGDIAHGKVVPKTRNSNPLLAHTISDITDTLVNYILNIYFITDWGGLAAIKYEDHQNFNEELDDQHQLDGISYSRALFDQDPISYEEMLNNYLSEKDST